MWKEGEADTSARPLPVHYPLPLSLHPTLSLLQHHTLPLPLHQAIALPDRSLRAQIPALERPACHRFLPFILVAAECADCAAGASRGGADKQPCAVEVVRGLGLVVAGGFKRQDYLLCSTYSSGGNGGELYLGVARLFIKLK